MIKYKILSSLELLNLSKPRVTLILKELIDNLLHLVNNGGCDNLSDFKNLCIQLKNKNINDISSFLTQNIVDYNVKLNAHPNITKADIEFIFKNNFPINKLSIRDLEL